MHNRFIEGVISTIRDDLNVIGLAAGGSMITNQIDEFSDLDLVLITEQQISSDPNQMMSYAKNFGNLLNAFTGDHVGERRLLICLYNDPLFHVDIKFITPEELIQRVENPVILFDRNGSIKSIIENSKAEWPELDFQWLADRFWTWIHYISLKLGRGEYFEAIDAISFLRLTVISPLLQIKNKQLPRGLRKVEQTFSDYDIKRLKDTVPQYTPDSIISSMERCIQLYRDLRTELFPVTVSERTETENKCVEYFYEIKKRIIK